MRFASGDSHDLARKRASRTGRRHPLVLPHPDIRRILDRGATTLILARALTPGLHEIHDALVIRRNAAHRRNGRPDMQSNPLVLTIEITTIEPRAVSDIDLVTARAAGFRTAADFREEWAARRRAVVVVNVCMFHHTEARFLHRDIHRGYTNDPREAATDELDRTAGIYAPEALSEADLDRMAAANRERDSQRRLDQLGGQTLAERLSLLEAAAASGDEHARRHLFVIKQRIEKAEERRARDAA